MLTAMSIAVFGSVGLAVYALLGIVFSEQRQVQRRLAGVTDYEARQVLEAQPMLRPFTERVVRPVGQRLASTAQLFAPKDYRVRLRERLVLAGMSAEDVGRVLAAKSLLALATPALVLVVGFLNESSPGLLVLLALVSAVIAFVAPDAFINSRVSERQHEIRRSLPDMLDMLNISVEAGLGFDAALVKIIRATSGPLSKEFARTLKEIQSGMSRGDALRGLAKRTQVPELNSFVMAIIQAEAFGISVSTVLRTQAAEMRLRRRQYAEEQAQKLPVKIVFPLVLCILPATMIVILGPAAVSIGEAFGLM